MKKAKRTFKRVVMLNPTGGWKNPLKEFGLGPGVLGHDVITYTDEKGLGFNHPSFAISRMEQDDELLHKMFLVRYLPMRKRRRK